MKQGIEKLYIFLSVLFYIGILFVIYLYITNNNTMIWLIAVTMVIVGLLSSVIPDMLINIEMIEAKLSVVRGIILNKYLIFCIVFMFLNKYLLLVNVLVGLSVIISFVLDIYLVKQMQKYPLLIGMFIKKIKEYDTTVIDKVSKYYEVYAISILFYLNIHNSLYELGIMLTINIIVHLFVLKKITEPIKCRKKRKIRLVLWAIFLLTIVVATCNQSMVTYSLIGIYVMISTDMLQKKKTSLLTIDHFK